jgi:hypothetical protein
MQALELLESSAASYFDGARQVVGEGRAYAKGSET